MNGKYLGISSLAIFSIGLIILTLFLFSNNSKLKESIGRLEENNKTLKIHNQEINTKIVVLKDSIKKNDSEIAGIMTIEMNLVNQLTETQTKLKQIKKQYEKATNYTHNWNGDSIRLYFANLK